MKLKFIYLTLLSCVFSLSSQSQCGPGEDTTPPEIIVPANTDIYGCEEFTGMNYTVSDNCTTGPLVTITADTISTHYSTGIQPSLGSNPCEYPNTWSFIAFNLGGTAYFQNSDLIVRYYGEDQVHIYGYVYNINQPSALLYLDLYFNNKRNWDEWSALGRSYKSDCGPNGAALHPSWSYFEVDPASHITGYVDLAGTEIDVTQGVPSYFWGIQMGEAANNLSEGYGIGGWLALTGSYVNSATGQSLTLNNSGSDLALELNDCYSPIVQWTYTATDEAGNTSTAVQDVRYLDYEQPYLEQQAPNSTTVCTGFTPWEATWIDCSPLTVTETQVLTESLYEYTSTATDACGASSSVTVTQTIVADDCALVGGCTDIYSCEYDPAALYDDGSCIYGVNCFGCMDYSAVNYDFTAGVDDGSCYFDQPTFFYDANADGLKSASEYGFADVVISSNNQQYSSNYDGQFIIENGIGQSYTFMPEPGMIVTTAITQEWTADAAPVFGITFDQSNSYVSYFMPSNSENKALCATGFRDALIIENPTNEAVRVWIELTNDRNLLLDNEQSWSANSSYDNMAGQMNWQYIELEPGKKKYISFEYMGALDAGDLGLHAVVSFKNYQNEIVSEFELDKTITVECITEPSIEITMYAETFGPDNLVLAGSPVALAIPLYNMTTEEVDEFTFDITFGDGALSLSDLHILNSTHDLNCRLNADGTLHIDMYESLSEQEVGVVFLSAVISEDLTNGTIFSPTMTAYADGVFVNEIGGNSATIFSCNALQGLTTTATVCEGAVVMMDFTQDFVTSYNWIIDGTIVSTESSFEYNATDAGEFTIELTLSNEICSATSSQLITVNPTPSNTISEPVDGIVTAPAGSSWEWFVEGNPNVVISDEQSWDVSALNTNIYVVTTNEFGCTSTSNSVATVSISENTIAFQLYPNPTEGMLTIQSTEVMESIVLFDALGKKVESYNPKGSVFTLDTTPFANGLYTAQIRTSSGTHSAVISVK